jgi:hypothetical protein
MSETRTENPSLDAEDWEIAFEVNKEHPLSALTLAYHLMALRGYLQSEIKNIPEALAAIDRAVDTLYQHSDFRHVSHRLFRATVGGAITTEQEHVIHQLGIRT